MKKIIINLIALTFVALLWGCGSSSSSSSDECTVDPNSPICVDTPNDEEDPVEEGL